MNETEARRVEDLAHHREEIERLKREIAKFKSGVMLNVLAGNEMLSVEHSIIEYREANLAYHEGCLNSLERLVGLPLTPPTVVRVEG
jgi:hypothetical protein